MSQKLSSKLVDEEKEQEDDSLTDHHNRPVAYGEPDYWDKRCNYNCFL
jgi:hypothetical protein